MKEFYYYGPSSVLNDAAKVKRNAIADARIAHTNAVTAARAFVEAADKALALAYEQANRDYDKAIADFVAEHDAKKADAYADAVLKNINSRK